jgi:acyl-CoA ligase (AMP-forming) (exosortase A-associated)
MIPLDPVPQPIDALPLRGAAGDVALVDRAGSLGFAGLEALTGAVAAWLAAQGLAQGARVASWLPKTRLACVLPMAAPRAGLVHVPINPVLKHAQVAHILGDSGADLLVTQGARAASLEAGDVPAGCRLVLEEKVAVDRDVMPPSRADPDALAAILYTSGSTGRPKGVMLSHANLWLGAISVAHYLKLSPADCVLGVLPLSFDYGQNQLFSTWAAGASVAPLDYLTARDVIKAVDRVQATTLAGVPPLWVQLLEAEWPVETAARLKRLTNSGGALTPGMIRGLRTRFPQADLYPMYGLTEAFRSTYLAPELVDSHPDAIGQAIPFAEVMAVRADGSRAAPDEPGELVHAGPLVGQGYWRDAERTALRFRPAPGWAKHGGLAVWSGDTVIEGADGLFRFVGRDDEMIKSAGNRISPTEIEDAVLSGGEAAEAVAIGEPDARLGQAIVVVARANGDSGDAEMRLRERLRRDLPSFMQPGRYEWVRAMPRNANGKLDRAAITRSVRRELVEGLPSFFPGEGRGPVGGLS